jgi:DNA-binding NarL/FixJ family response regulator
MNNVTPREGEVLEMLGRGFSTSEIARRLAISPITVRRHTSDLVRKIGVEDRAALVRSQALVGAEHRVIEEDPDP